MSNEPEELLVIQGPQIVIPETIGGMLTAKRYARLRKMGIKTTEIAALVMMHHRGEYPGNRLFTAKRKKDILSPKYKKLRKQTEKEVNEKYKEMRAEWIDDLKVAKKKLEEQGVDFKKLEEEAKDESARITKDAPENRD